MFLGPATGAGPFPLYVANGERSHAAWFNVADRGGPGRRGGRHADRRAGRRDPSGCRGVGRPEPGGGPSAGARRGRRPFAARPRNTRARVRRHTPACGDAGRSRRKRTGRSSPRRPEAPGPGTTARRRASCFASPCLLLRPTGPGARRQPGRAWTVPTGIRPDQLDFSGAPPRAEHFWCARKGRGGQGLRRLLSAFTCHASRDMHGI